MTDPFYRTSFWRRLREAALQAHPLCCTAGCRAPSVVADHILPRSQGGADNLDNLRGRCITCHNTRRGTAEPRLRGAELDGRPRDRAHWWNAPAISQGWPNRTASRGLPAVSSPPSGGRRDG